MAVVDNYGRLWIPGLNTFDEVSVSNIYIVYYYIINIGILYCVVGMKTFVVTLLSYHRGRWISETIFSV